MAVKIPRIKTTTSSSMSVKAVRFRLNSIPFICGPLSCDDSFVCFMPTG